MDALGKIQIFCSCLQAWNHECSDARPVTTSLYRLMFYEQHLNSPIGRYGHCYEQPFCWSVNGMWIVVPVRTHRRGVHAVTQIIVFSSCQTGYDGVMYEKSTGSFPAGKAAEAWH